MAFDPNQNFWLRHSLSDPRQKTVHIHSFTGPPTSYGSTYVAAEVVFGNFKIIFVMLLNKPRFLFNFPFSPSSFLFCSRMSAWICVVSSGLTTDQMLTSDI